MEFQSFQSLDDMLQHIKTAGEAADKRVLPWQQHFKPGDLFVRIENMGPDDDLVIFGEVLPEEPEYAERSPEEKHRLRFYHFSRCYSVVVEEGEYGDTHACTIGSLITRAMFDEAKARSWSPDVLVEWINQKQVPLYALDRQRMMLVASSTDESQCDGCPLIHFFKGHPNYAGECLTNGIYCPMRKGPGDEAPKR